MKYDLELEGGKGIKAHSGIKEVLSDGLNTPEKVEPIEISEKCWDEEEGIKVLSSFSAMNKKNLKTGAPSKGNGGDGDISRGCCFMMV